MFTHAQTLNTQTRNDPSAYKNGDNSSFLSGFFQANVPQNFPNTGLETGFWRHLIDVRHTDPKFAMQLSGYYWDQDLWFRKIGVGFLNQGWSRVVAEDPSGNIYLKNRVNSSNAGNKILFSVFNDDNRGPYIRSSLHYANGESSLMALKLGSYWEGEKNELTLINGNVGVDVDNPTQKLDVGGGIKVLTDLITGGSNSWIYHTPDNNNTSLFIAPYSEGNGGDWLHQFQFQNNGNLITRGAVGIGREIPLYRLDVLDNFRAGKDDNNYFAYNVSDISLKSIDRGDNGPARAMVHDVGNILTLNYNDDFKGGTKIGNYFLVKAENASLHGKFEAKEIKVTQSPTADFVFEDTYKLPTLDEVEKHIKENKYLPEIASAKTMEKEGVNVGEFQIKLLQKIEELTLYSIEQNKQIKLLHEKNEFLQDQIFKIMGKKNINTKN